MDIKESKNNSVNDSGTSTVSNTSTSNRVLNAPRNKSIEKIKNTNNERLYYSKSIQKCAKQKNQESLYFSPRQSVVENVLDRDRLYSIALPPSISDNKISLPKQ